jgi:adenylate cyclase
MDLRSTGETVLFEGWRFKRQNRLLFRQDATGDCKPVSLGSRALDILALLLERPGLLVSRDALLDAVWPDTTVDPTNLTVQIAGLRRVLDSDRTYGTCIQTVVGRGYRFVVPVQYQDDAPALASEVGPVVPTSLPGRPSIAVLAFANLSDEPGQEFFSDGIAEDIITELSRRRWLFVIARTSSFTYKTRSLDVRQIARELGVGYVLEGGVRLVARRVRVSAQLIDATAGEQIWAERYDRAFDDVLAIQDEIAIAAVSAIQPVIVSAERRRILRKPPESLNAWESYQRGLWYMEKTNRTDNVAAQLCFHRAIGLDEMFASPHAALGLSTYLDGATYAVRPFGEAADQAERWARQALAIDSDEPNAHAVLASSARAAGDRDRALEHVSLALSNNPNSSLALGVEGAILLHSNRPTEARIALLKAIRLDPVGPRNSHLLNEVAISYYFERDYVNALATARRGVARYPGYPPTHRWLAASLGQLGHAEDAGAALRQAIAVAPDAFALFVRHRIPWFRSEDYEHMREGLRMAGWRD